MSDTGLFVTGFPSGCDEALVKSVFTQYFPVKSIKVLPPQTGKTDGAAIVFMEKSHDAKWLIDNVSGKVPQGLTEPIIIKKKIVQGGSNKGWGKGWGYMNMPPWAYQMAWGKGKGGGKGWSGGGLRTFPAEKKVWIGNLPEEGITFKELQEHFPGSKFATVMSGNGKGTGGVAFATAEEAEAAIKNLNGSVLGGNTIVVDVWTKKEKDDA
eukprot:TRINITY_DN63650_c0_g1_i1.p1 TRINITY_DN63650_c0_g1~~TRINITY_DN63650_c0_g1_i1.p1  ORF type:complete len:210 (+),score=43.92 TRINITY_DN63650_c0_g1_i1:36-665(+)